MIFLLLNSVYSQSCFSLSTTTTLPDLRNYQIVQTEYFKDVASFDAYYMSKMDSNQSYVDTFKSFFTCPKWDGKAQRFHMSYFAFYLIQISNVKGCSNSNLPMLCKDTCLLAKQALENLFKEPGTCDSLPYNATGPREQTLNAYDSFCKSLSVDNTNSGKCVPAIDMELKQCGFPNPGDSSIYCSKFQDPCCATLGTTINFLEKPGSNSKLIIIIVSSCIGGLVVIAIAVYFYLKKKSTAEPVRPSTWSEDRLKGKPIRFTSSDNTPILFKNSDNSKSGQQSNIFSEISTKTLQEPTPNPNEFVTMHAYNPTLPDECLLVIGDRVVVEKVFDDGWAVGINQRTLQKGAFPLACLNYQ